MYDLSAPGNSREAISKKNCALLFASITNSKSSSLEKFVDICRFFRNSRQMSEKISAFSHVWPSTNVDFVASLEVIEVQSSRLRDASLNSSA